MVVCEPSQTPALPSSHLQQCSLLDNTEPLPGSRVYYSRPLGLDVHSDSRIETQPSYHKQIVPLWFSRALPTNYRKAVRSVEGHWKNTYPPHYKSARGIGPRPTFVHYTTSKQ
ncbi:hypothetical protein V496_01747 [Pseudogymnoascus sp. VKM F-4515 (FW-2607)]|nr:hypothetical protein V496_01747 [Pseudogymnoascus sp. VKM F-4515 (FW-2607)]